MAGIDVHHLGQHHYIPVGLAGLEVQHRDRGAESDPIGRRLVVGELAQLAQALMQLAEPGLDELLTLEGRLVLGVFPQVTQLDGLGDRLGKKDIEFMAELVDLTAQLLTHFLDHMKPDEVEAPGDGNRQASKGVPTVKDTAGPAFRKVPAAEVYDS